MNKFYITKHAIDRLIERSPDVCKICPYLKTWDGSGHPERFRGAIDEIVAKSSENKAIINDSVYMMGYYERYGYNNDFKFMESQDFHLKFVLTKDRGEKDFRLVTVIPFDGIQKTNHWSNIKKQKESKIAEQFQDFNDMGQLALQSSKPLSQQKTAEVDIAIKKRLFSLARNNKTKIMTKISHSTSIHSASLDGMYYEFKSCKIDKAENIEVYVLREQKKKMNP